MKTLIAVPCFDMVHTDFMRSMVELHKPDDTSFTVLKNTLIYTARNIVAANAIEYGFDRVMWFDSDMSFPADTLLRLSQHMDNGYDFVSGLYFARKPPEIKPIMYKKLWWENQGDKIDTGAENYWDYPEGLTKCAAVGFGCALTSVDLLKRVGERFGSPFTPIDCMGEDMAFCWRVNQIGGEIYVDTTIKCGHVGQYEYTEKDYKSLHPNAP